MIALISDIHGNYEALKAVLEEIDKKNIKKIFCLGDVAGYYSEINECCNELRKRNIVSTMGNHDWYLVTGVPCERSQSVNDCLAYQKKVITKENLNWIQNFKTVMVSDGICMLHGGWSNPIDEYIKLSRSYFTNIPGTFFASGHSHIQQVFMSKGKIYCNPGSVGQPRDGDNRAAYATFDGKKFYLYRVQYDYAKTAKKMKEAGFNSYYYGCLIDGAAHLHKL